MPGSPPGATAFAVSSTSSVVPAPSTSRVCIRRSVTRYDSRQPACTRQSGGSCSSGSPPPTRGCPSSHSCPSNSSRLRIFQYDGRVVATRSTSDPSRGQLSGP